MSRAVVFAYSSVGCECLKALLEMGVEIPLVYTHEDDPNEEQWFDSVRALSESKGLNVLTISITKDNLPRELERVKNAAPDVIFSCYYRKIIPLEILNLAPLGAFNMHGGLLPKYRGRAPVNWTILNGEHEAGMTLHRMTDKPDSGDIIDQRRVAIGPNDTAIEIFEKLILESGLIMRQSLPKILDGTAVGIPQDESQATCFGRRRPEDGLIDWRKSAQEIHNLVRAVTWPFPGAFTFLKDTTNANGNPDGRKLMVWRTQLCDGCPVNDAEPGTVVLTAPLCVATGKGGMLEIIEAQWVDEGSDRKNFDTSSFRGTLAVGSAFKVATDFEQKNKRLSYGRQWITDEDIAEVAQVLRGDWLTGGPAVSAFERALEEYTGAKHAVTFANGTAALHGAMAASGLSHGQKSLTTAMTFAATATSAIYAGGEPVFVDIDPETLCLDPELAAEKLSELASQGKQDQVKVIAPVSFTGYPFDIAPFRELADRYGLVLIEDGAHSLGGDRGTHKIGVDADMTALSFHPVKHITTGEGGAVLTNSDEFANRLRAFRNHGLTRDPSKFTDNSIQGNDGPWHSEIQSLGYNYRLSDIQCALGLSQIRRLDTIIARRREIAKAYRELLADCDAITLPADHPGHAYHLFVIQVNDESQRKPLFEYLAANAITLQVHYKPVPLEPFYRKKYGFKPGDFPMAERYFRRTISLPIFPTMTDGDVERVASVIQNFLRFKI